MKVRIIKGALVGQDFGCHRWPHRSYDVDQVFEVFDCSIEGKRKLVAEGFGLLNVPGKYGNGPVFARDEDLVVFDK